LGGQFFPFKFNGKDEYGEIRNDPIAASHKEELTSSRGALTVCFVRRTITSVDRRLAPNPTIQECAMFQTPEQLIQIQKASVESTQAATLKSLEGFEKLAELNLQAVKASIDEASEQFRALFDVKDPQAFAELAQSSVQPTAEKLAAYSKHVYDITNETGTGIASIYEKQFAEASKLFQSAVDQLAKNAPVGSEGIVTFVRQALTAANSAADQVTAATKQAVELAESNFSAAAAKAAPRSKKVA
jgi:phasin family protein